MAAITAQETTMDEIAMYQTLRPVRGFAGDDSNVVVPDL